MTQHRASNVVDFYSRPGRLRLERFTAGESTFILQPVGELDMLTTPAMHQALQASLRPGRRVVVNLAHVSFLGSHGMQALLDANRTATTDGAVLVITGATHRAVARPLALTGIDEALPLLETASPGHDKHSSDQPSPRQLW